MEQQKLYIKGMVCERCIESVRELLQDLSLAVSQISLGEAIIETGTPINYRLVDERLQNLGFSLLQNRKERLVHELKELVEEVYSGKFVFEPNFNFSRLAIDKLNLAYENISTIFLTVENTTIEKFILQYRIEKTKSLLTTTNKTITDISFALGFSSVSHLSKQFNSITGLTPSAFKELTRIQHIHNRQL
ncbi:helix-turn-helix domain-containing protein [Flavitalea sp.]|nr:helix-turn-helix transcriptional regulator [Flavitalea sp.]